MDESLICHIKNPLNFSEPRFACLLVGNNISTINFQMIDVKANDPHDKCVTEHETNNYSSHYCYLSEAQDLAEGDCPVH